MWKLLLKGDKIVHTQAHITIPNLQDLFSAIKQKQKNKKMSVVSFYSVLVNCECVYFYLFCMLFNFEHWCE